ncbi:MAG: ORC1-type DNA replication protein [Desulfurococcaceae archaeon]
MTEELMGQGIWKSIERELEGATIFRNRESLAPEFVPDSLPHRDREIEELVRSFKFLLTSPGALSQRVLVLGKVGTGKTALVRVFARDFSRVALRSGVKVRYAHVNCHRNRTLHNVVADIAFQLDVPLPTRGLSAKEMFDALLTYLDDRNEYAIVALDEFHYFASLAGKDAVYFLARSYDATDRAFKRLNFVFIAQDVSKLGLLDSSLSAYLARNVIKLEPYSSGQLYDILRYRAEQAFYEGVVEDEVLEFIARYEGVDAGGEGNARHALEILAMAGDLAERERARRVALDHVRKAITLTSRELVVLSDAIQSLSLHELLFLLAIVRLLRRSGRRYVKMGDAEREYGLLCELLSLQPRKHTQVYEYAMNLKKTGLLEAVPSGEGFRGRTTLLGISYGPLDVLEKYLEELVKRRANSHGGREKP